MLRSLHFGIRKITFTVPWTYAKTVQCNKQRGSEYDELNKKNCHDCSMCSLKQSEQVSTMRSSSYNWYKECLPVTETLMMGMVKVCKAIYFSIHSSSSGLLRSLQHQLR